MITAIEAAQLCSDSYAYPGAPPRQWTHWEGRSVNPNDGGTVAFGYQQYPTEDVFVFPGTSDFGEWMDDFDFVSRPIIHADLGDVHYGFLIGMEEAWTKIAKLWRRGVPGSFLGHSLGAARASVACALAMRAGVLPAARIVFGEPQPGFESFCKILRAIPRQESYCNGDRNGHDLVTDVPFTIPPLWTYSRPIPLTSVSASPGADIRGRWGAFAYHHCPLYVQALKNLIQ